jgi:hypothetical protein
VIVLAHTRLHPVTARLANQHAPGHRRVRLDPLDSSAYWRLLAKAWTEPGDLVVIEQDIGLRPGVIAGFEACRQPWCGHPYLIGGRELVCLGCTRFTAELKTAVPDLFDLVAARSDPGLPGTHWRRLDERIASVLEARGYTRHRHQPAVAHYHRYPTV